MQNIPKNRLAIATSFNEYSNLLTHELRQSLLYCLLKKNVHSTLLSYGAMVSSSLKKVLSKTKTPHIYFVTVNFQL